MPWRIPDKNRVYDPLWLRNSYRRCLWDGGATNPATDFCCDECAEAYANWEEWELSFDEERHIVEAGAVDAV